MEELEQLENKTMDYMAGKFKNLRFRRTQNTSSKVDLATVDPVAQGSEETEVDHLQDLTKNLATRQGW